MDYNELKEFIKSVAKSGVSEVDIKTEAMRIVIRMQPKGTGAAKHTETVIQQIPVPTFTTTSPIQQTAPVPVENTNKQDKTDKSDEPTNLITIKSPIVGTFYRKASPDKPEYIKIGDTVKPDTVVCIVEAMKLFNEIEAEVSGKIVKVLVQDASPVEFDQPLFLVEPA